MADGHGHGGGVSEEEKNMVSQFAVLQFGLTERASSLFNHKSQTGQLEPVDNALRYSVQRHTNSAVLNFRNLQSSPEYKGSNCLR